jgi:hypothetical protein
MLEFLRIYAKWIVFSDDHISLKAETPTHIVNLFNDVKKEQNAKRQKGIFID